MSNDNKNQIADWLRAAPAVRGTLMRAIRFPDQTFISDLEARDFSPAALEQAFRLIGDTFQVLSAQRFPPTRLTWLYERTALHCAQRSDGTILGIFISRKIPDPDADGLHRLLADFQLLAPSASA